MLNRLGFLRPNMKSFCVSIVVGFSISVAFINLFVGYGRWSLIGYFSFLGALVIILSFIVNYRLRRWCRSWLTFRTNILWALTSLLVAGLAMVIIPITVRLPLDARLHTLEIVATGEKNPDAQSASIGIISAQWINGIPLNDSEIHLSGSWRLRDGILFSLPDQPASIKWSGEAIDHLSLTLVSSPTSGIVKIIWDGQVQSIDLYNQQYRQQTILLSKNILMKQQPKWWLLLIGLNFAYIVALSSFILLSGVWLLSRSDGFVIANVSRWEWLAYALPSLVVWTVWLLAFWPGVMSPDSVDQWQQMLTGRYLDQHPPFHTLTNWVITRLWLSPAAVAITQILILSLTVGWGIVQLRRLGIASPVAWVTSGVFALSPVNGITVITLWKDIFYSVAILGITILLLKIVASDGKWLTNKISWIVLGVLAASIGLYRQNGFAAGFGTLMFLLVVYRRYWRPVLLALLFAVLLWIGIRGPLYNALNVSRNRWFPLTPLIHQVGAHLVAGTPLSDRERDYLDTIHPLVDNWNYYCYAVDKTIFDGRFRGEIIAGDPIKFLRTWWILTSRRPAITLHHLVCSSSLVWRVTQPPQGFLNVSAVWQTPDGILTIVPNQLGLKPASILPGVRTWLWKWIEFTTGTKTISLVWRPALYLYIGIIAVLVLSVKLRKQQYFLVITPVFLHSVLLLLITIHQAVRYQYATYLIGLLMVGVLLQVLYQSIINLRQKL